MMLSDGMRVESTLRVIL